MVLLSSPLKNDPPETKVSIFFFLEIEIVTTKIVSSKSLKKICRQLLSTMNVFKLFLSSKVTTCFSFQTEFLEQILSELFSFKNEKL